MTLKHKFALCYFNVKLWATYIIPQEGNWEERDLDVEQNAAPLHNAQTAVILVHCFVPLLLTFFVSSIYYILQVP